MESNYFDLIKILEEVKSLVRLSETDIDWSAYNNIDDLITDIDNYINKLKQYNESVYNDLKLLFAPTGSLQEISINSGWSDQFIFLSTLFDKLIDA